MKTNLRCKFCKSNNTQGLFSSFNAHGRHILDIQEKFNIRKCLDCDCLFISDIAIDQHYYDKYYKSNYYFDNINSKIISKIWTFLYNFLFKKKEKYILKFLKNNKSIISILDIGCGAGNFLADLNSEKFEKNGVEINIQAIKLCRKKNINIYEGDINTIDFKGKKFDIITLWHVFEHLESPITIFEKAKEILNDQGLLILQVPNNKSLGFKFGRKYWFHLDSPRHLVIPNWKTIQKACQKTDFKLIKIKNEFYDYPLDLFWSVRKSKIKFLIYPLYPIFKFFSKEHLTFICKKYAD